MSVRDTEIRTNLMNEISYQTDYFFKRLLRLGPFSSKGLRQLFFLFTALRFFWKAFLAKNIIQWWLCLISMKLFLPLMRTFSQKEYFFDAGCVGLARNSPLSWDFKVKNGQKALPSFGIEPANLGSTFNSAEQLLRLAFFWHLSALLSTCSVGSP